jgi:hypothetical protein
MNEERFIYTVTAIYEPGTVNEIIPEGTLLLELSRNESERKILVSDGVTEFAIEWNWDRMIRQRMSENKPGFMVAYDGREAFYARPRCELCGGRGFEFDDSRKGMVRRAQCPLCQAYYLGPNSENRLEHQNFVAHWREGWRAVYGLHEREARLVQNDLKSDNKKAKPAQIAKIFWNDSNNLEIVSAANRALYHFWNPPMPSDPDPDPNPNPI